MNASLTARKRSSLPLAMALAIGVIGIDLLCQGFAAQAAEKATPIPEPVIDQMAAAGGLETAVVAGGCFWGVQAVFQHVEGVETAVSGYAGGAPDDATYKQVSAGVTRHAEAVEITYDPAKISYGKLLQIFFSVAHDPTQVNRQGPDVGPQYRSAVFFDGDEQKKVVESYVDQLDETGLFAAPIATEVSSIETFYPAEAYHQDYAFYHPNQPYIVWNDLPKVENLKAMFPDVWRDEPRLVNAGGGS